MEVPPEPLGPAEIPVLAGGPAAMGEMAALAHQQMEARDGTGLTRELQDVLGNQAQLSKM